MNRRPVLVCLLFLFLAATAQAQEQAVITGTITDAATDEPLFGVHVFLSGTTTGTTTDPDGRYRFSVPAGVVRLAASYLGYESQVRPLVLEDAGPHEQHFRLKANAFGLEEVTVTAERDRQWARDLRRFERAFLGETPNARRTEIENPEVLDFEHEGSTFRATARAPLVLHNEGLGYRLRYDLDQFEEAPGVLFYKGEPFFEELEAESRRQARRWEEAREEAFRGSLRHFLLALIHQKSEQEGFRVYDPYLQASIIRSNKSDFNADTLLQRNYTPRTHRIAHERTVEVLYFGERESTEFLQWRNERTTKQPGPQPSAFYLTMGPAIVDDYGVLLDPLALSLDGYFAFERIADLLPEEYLPDDLDLSLPEAPPMVAQAEEDPLTRRLQVQQWFQSGASAYQQQQYAEAEKLLGWVMEADPAFADAERGSAAYWLGLTLVAQEQPAEALRIWKQGLRALDAADLFDARLANAYVRRAAARAAEQPQQADLAFASRIYLLLLERADDVPAEAMQHLAAQLEALLTKEERAAWIEQVGEGKWPTRRLRPGAGPALAAWWRERDPLPATEENERVEEHLLRVAEAERQYGHEQRPEGYDERGVIYVRLGRPTTEKAIRFRPEKFSKLLSRHNLHAPPPLERWPPTQIWVYENLDYSAYYLFVQDEADLDYRISTTERLFPEEFLITIYRNQDTELGGSWADGMKSNEFIRLMTLVSYMSDV